ncbi:hypothetical protein ACTXOR_11250 [Arthrobacter rhombi]|uniref:hypothetical protein n=1 Tax=Arthrobacter rhombi TaxID=71253 RepID=UPI003FD1F00D
MGNSTAFSLALKALQTTGAATMPGKPAWWSKATRGLFLVLIVLVSLLAVGLPIFLIVFPSSESVRVTGATIVGFTTVEAMVTGGLALLITGYRRHGEYVDFECRDVRLEARGMTLRGIGPIPWEDFGAAQSVMVRSEHSGGYTLRAVMPLTASGLFNVNTRMSRRLRRYVSPALGPFWNRHHRWIYVPGVEEMSEGDVMELINTAHWMFGQTVQAK